MPHIKGSECSEEILNNLYKRCSDAVQQQIEIIEYNGHKYQVEHVQNFIWWVRNRPCMKSKIGCPSIDHGDTDDIFLKS